MGVSIRTTNYKTMASLHRKLVIFAALCVMAASATMSDETAPLKTDETSFEGIHRLQAIAVSRKAASAWQNILALKAYSIAALQKARSMQNSHASMAKSVLCNFVASFGKPLKPRRRLMSLVSFKGRSGLRIRKHKKHNDIVVQYASTLRKLSKKYKKGI